MLIHDPALSAAPVDGFVLGRWNFVFGWRALRPAGRPTRQRGETKHHCHPVPSARQWPLPSPASAIPLVLVLVIELRTANSRCHHARRQKDIKARHPIRASLFNRRVCASRHVRRCRDPIDYEHEHRCAEHEHEHESIGVTHNGNDCPAPERIHVSPGFGVGVFESKIWRLGPVISCCWWATTSHSFHPQTQG